MIMDSTAWNCWNGYGKTCHSVHKTTYLTERDVINNENIIKTTDKWLLVTKKGLNVL